MKITGQKLMGIALAIFILTGTCLQARGGITFGFGLYPNRHYFGNWYGYYPHNAYAALAFRDALSERDLRADINENRKIINIQGETIKDLVEATGNLSLHNKTLDNKIEELSNQLQRKIDGKDKKRSPWSLSR